MNFPKTKLNGEIKYNPWVAIFANWEAFRGPYYKVRENEGQAWYCVLAREKNTSLSCEPFYFMHVPPE